MTYLFLALCLCVVIRYFCNCFISQCIQGSIMLLHGRTSCTCMADEILYYDNFSCVFTLAVHSSINWHVGCPHIRPWRIFYEHGCAKMFTLLCSILRGMYLQVSPPQPPTSTGQEGCSHPSKCYPPLLSLLVQLLSHTEAKWEHLM